MARTYDQIDARMKTWIDQQKIFFVASAPLSGEGMVNCSPKGLDTFRVIDSQKVAYLDYTGSGAETLAHLRENGRIVIMMCAFEGRPRIVRFHGHGQAHERGTQFFDQLSGAFEQLDGARCIITVDLNRISDSCGYTVPRYTFQGDRQDFQHWIERKGPDGVTGYQKKMNRTSLDGLPGMCFGESGET